MINVPVRYFIGALVTLLCVSAANGQPRAAAELFNETELYVANQIKEMQSAGKSVGSGTREDLESARKKVAAKYAEEVSARTDLENTDLFYLGRLYATSGNEAKAMESMKRFLAAHPPEAKTTMVQLARLIVIAYASRRKQMAEAEALFDIWNAAGGRPASEKVTLQEHLSLGYYKDGQYDKAIRHAHEAFTSLKSLKAKTLPDKRDRERIFMNLTEVLALSYQKSKNTDQALNILAEARAESFAIPSAELYRKVMTFVEGGGFSEKKLMQKVESYAVADPAPEMDLREWIGHDPIAIEQLRGRVVLLDFWATWCGPCIATFPRLRSWHKEYGGDDFIIVGVTQYYGQQGGKKMSPLQELDFLNEFKRKHKLPYPFAIAAPTEARMKYGINSFPTTVLLDRKGVVRYIGIGSGLEESENLEDMIRKVVVDERKLAIAK